MLGPTAPGLRLGVAAALGSAALGLSVMVAPQLGAFLSILAPAPLMAAYLKGGTRVGRLASAGAMALAALAGLFDFGAAFFFVAVCVPMALALGETMARGVQPAKAIGAGALAAVLVTGALLAWGQSGSEVSLKQQWQEQWLQVADYASAQMAAQAELGAKEASLLRDMVIASGRSVFYTAPGFISGFCLLMAWANLLIARRARSREAGPESLPLNTWQTPFVFVWLVIAALALAVLFDDGVYWLGVNTIIVLSVIYFLQGVAVLAYIMDKRKVPPLLRFGVYTLLVIAIQFTVFLFAAVGLFDTWFNFRRFGHPQTPE